MFLLVLEGTDFTTGQICSSFQRTKNRQWKATAQSSEIEEPRGSHDWWLHPLLAPRNESMVEKPLFVLVSTGGILRSRGFLGAKWISPTRRRSAILRVTRVYVASRCPLTGGQGGEAAREQEGTQHSCGGVLRGKP